MPPDVPTLTGGGPSFKGIGLVIDYIDLIINFC